MVATGPRDFQLRAGGRLLPFSLAVAKPAFEAGRSGGRLRKDRPHGSALRPGAGDDWQVRRRASLGGGRRRMGRSQPVDGRRAPSRRRRTVEAGGEIGVEQLNLFTLDQDLYLFAYGLDRRASGGVPQSLINTGGL